MLRSGGGTGVPEKLKGLASSTLIHEVPMQSLYQSVGTIALSDAHFSGGLLYPGGRLDLANSNIVSESRSI